MGAAEWEAGWEVHLYISLGMNWNLFIAHLMVSGFFVYFLPACRGAGEILQSKIFRNSRKLKLRRSGMQGSAKVTNIKGMKLR